MLKQSHILIYIHAINALTKGHSEENPVCKKDFQSRNLFGERLRTHFRQLRYSVQNRSQPVPKFLKMRKD